MTISTLPDDFTVDQQFDMIAIDLDGTLVDSVGDLHAAVVRMQESINHAPSSISAVRQWVGNGIERLVHRALTGSMQDDAPSELFERSILEFMSAYEISNGSASQLYPGVKSGLDWLTTLDVPIVCITNKAGIFSRPLLKALGIADYFDHHLAGDDVQQKKPHPDALLEAARLSEARPSRCLIIGDSISDILAGRAAGFSVIAVSYGYNHGRPVAELDGDERPDAVVDSFSQLPEAFATLWRKR